VPQLSVGGCALQRRQRSPVNATLAPRPQLQAKCVSASRGRPSGRVERQPRVERRFGGTGMPVPLVLPQAAYAHNFRLTWRQQCSPCLACYHSHTPCGDARRHIGLRKSRYPARIPGDGCVTSRFPTDWRG
jgi:hypothetical protein